MTAYGVSLSPVSIDPRLNQPRAPVLPAAARGPDFERRFDHLTLFNDIFWEPGGESILAIGPHVPSHFDPELDIRFTCLSTGASLAATYLPSRVHIHGDMFRITPAAETTALLVAVGQQQTVVSVQPNLSHLLAGRRVLTNRCQNDPLEWLVDWAHFHVTEFGFDAILHYDNQSTAYSVDDVRQALAAVPGLDVVIALSWPFPLEPAHAEIPGAGRFFWQRQLKDRWAEACRLEHQRRRFLADAELVLVADTDELVIQRNPGMSIDDLFCEPDVAWVKLDSNLIVNTADPPERLMRHRDLHWIWDNPGFKTPKYLVKPRRCPDEARWWLHDIAGAPGRDVPPDNFTIAHFYALSTGWGGKAGRGARQTPIPGVHHEDLLLRDTLNRAFPTGLAPVPAWTPASSEDPHLLRKAAYEAIRAAATPTALGYLNRAIARDPYHPEQYKARAEMLNSLPVEPSDG